MEIQIAPMAADEPLPSFDTPRLHLRPLGAGDGALYRRLYSDAGVMRHIAAPLSSEAAQRAFHKVIAQMRQPTPPMRLWVLSQRAETPDLGIVALMRDAEIPDALELGAMLLAAGQGRGLAAEAQTALLDWLFSRPGVRMVWSRNAPGNGAEVGVRLKLGFVLVEAAEAVGPYLVWQMDRRRWLARHDPPALAM